MREDTLLSGTPFSLSREMPRVRRRFSRPSDSCPRVSRRRGRRRSRSPTCTGHRARRRGGTRGQPRRQPVRSRARRSRSAASAPASIGARARRGSARRRRRCAAGALYDVIVTNPGEPSGVLPKGWFADFLDVPQASPFHAPVETIIRDGITSGCGGGNYCPTPRSHARRWRSSCCAPSTARRTCRLRRRARSSATSPPTRLRRRLDRAALRRRNHGRLPRRNRPPTVLPDRVGRRAARWRSSS